MTLRPQLPTVTSSGYNFDMTESTDFYGYTPNLGANVFFLVVAATGLLATLVITIYTRQYVVFGSLVGVACVLETMGYTSRLYSHTWPGKSLPYTYGTTVLVLAPGFLSSSMYSILIDVVRVLGEEHIPSASYPKLLTGLDAAGLLLEVIGLAVAFSNDTPAVVDKGLYVVAAGLAFQLVALVISLGVAASVIVRVFATVRKYGYTTFHRDVGYMPLTIRFKFLAAALTLDAMMLLVRGVYRIAELSQGHMGLHEDIFIGLESVPVCLAIALLAGCHPGLFLRDGKERRMSNATGVVNDGEDGEKRDGFEDLEALGAVARQSPGMLGRSWSLKSWGSKRVSGRRDRPANGLQTTMCTQ